MSILIKSWQICIVYYFTFSPSNIFLIKILVAKLINIYIVHLNVIVYIGAYIFHQYMIHILAYSYHDIWWETIFKSKLFCLWKCSPGGILLLYPMINVSHPPDGILVNVNILSVCLRKMTFSAVFATYT